MIGDETHKNVLATSFSGKRLAEYPVLIGALLDVKEAALIANRESGSIEAEDTLRVCQAIADIRKDLSIISGAERENIFPVDVFGGGGCIGIHLNVSEYISLRSGVPLALINRSQSTADVCHTAFRVAIIKSWPALAQKISKTILTMTSKATAYQEVFTLGRTCLQDAGIISMGHSLSAYPQALQRRMDAIGSNIGALHAVNLGATAMGTSENAAPSYREMVLKTLSQIAELKLVHRDNFFDAAQNSDDLGILIQELGQLALVLMKLARDLRMLSSGPRGGFGEISLPKVHEGSSFYKNKNNPIVPETMLQCGFLVLGACRTVESALEHAELQLNVFDNAAAISALDCMGWLTLVLGLFESFCLSGLQVSRERCQELSSLASPLKNER